MRLPLVIELLLTLPLHQKISPMLMNRLLLVQEKRKRKFKFQLLMMMSGNQILISSLNFMIQIRLHHSHNTMVNQLTDKLLSLNQKLLRTQLISQKVMTLNVKLPFWMKISQDVLDSKTQMSLSRKVPTLYASPLRDSMDKMEESVAC